MKNKLSDEDRSKLLLESQKTHPKINEEYRLAIIDELENLSHLSGIEKMEKVAANLHKRFRERTG